MLPIIHRNTTIPVSRLKRVQTIEPNQTQLKVEVYQGENRHVKNNILLGELTISGIPHGPAGQEIDIRFTYDLNGVLEVEVVIVATKRKVTHVITRHARGLAAGQIARAVEEMQALKMHPRDEAEHRALLKRAERVYQELPLQRSSTWANCWTASRRPWSWATKPPSSTTNNLLRFFQRARSDLVRRRSAPAMTSPTAPHPRCSAEDLAWACLVLGVAADQPPERIGATAWRGWKKHGSCPRRRWSRPCCWWRTNCRANCGARRRRRNAP